MRSATLAYLLSLAAALVTAQDMSDPPPEPPAPIPEGWTMVSDPVRSDEDWCIVSSCAC